MAKKTEQETASTEAVTKAAEVKRLPRKKKKQLGRASKSGKTGG